MDETVRMLASKGIAQAPTADGLVCTNPLLPDGRCAILSDDDGRITVRLCRPGGSGPSRIVVGADAAGAVVGWLTGLAAARQSRGLTQAELAAAAGIAPARVSRYETGRIRDAANIAAGTLDRLARALHMDMGDLYRIMTGRLEPLSVPVKPSYPRDDPHPAEPSHASPVGSGPVECVTHTRGHEHTRQ